MKTLNIVTMSLLFAAGSLFGRLDLQKVDKWKKEDSSTWTQAKVDEILKHINLPANKTGNEPLLNPLFKKIDNWNIQQAAVVAAQEATRKKLADEATAAAKTAEAARRKLADEATAAKAKLEEARIVEAQKEKTRIAAEDEAKRLADEKATQEKQAKAQADLEKRKLEEIAAEEEFQKYRAIYKKSLDKILIRGAEAAAAADQKLKDAQEEHKRAVAEVKRLREEKATPDIMDRAKLEGEVALATVKREEVLAALEEKRAKEEKDRIEKEQKEITKEQAHDIETAAKAEAAKALATENAAAYIKETTATIQSLRTDLEEGRRLIENEKGLLNTSIKNNSLGEAIIEIAKEVLAIDKALSDLDAQRIKFTSDKTPKSRALVRMTIQDIMRRQDIKNAPSVAVFGDKLLSQINALEKEQDLLRQQADKDAVAKEKATTIASDKEQTERAKTEAAKKVAEEKAAKEQKETDDAATKEAASNKTLKALDFEKNFLTQDRELKEKELAERKANILEIKNRAEMKNVASVQTLADTLLADKKIKAYDTAQDLIKAASAKIAKKTALSEDGLVLSGDISSLKALEANYPSAGLLLRANDVIKKFDPKKKNVAVLDGLISLFEEAKKERDAATIEDQARIFNGLYNAFNKAFDPNFKPIKLEEVWEKKK